MNPSARILDNKSLGNVISELKENIATGCILSVISALFSLYAYKELTSSVHQNLIHLSHADNDEQLAIVGSSSFTTEGLGIVPSESHHMNTCFHSSDETHSFIKNDVRSL